MTTISRMIRADAGAIAAGSVYAMMVGQRVCEPGD